MAIADEDGAREREQRDRQSRKQLAFGSSEDIEPSPQRQMIGRVQQRGRICAEFANRSEIAGEPERRMNRAIPEQQRENQDSGRHPRRADRQELAGARPWAREPQDPEAHEDGEEHQVIAVADTLQEPSCGKQREPPRPRIAQIAMQSQQRKGHRKRREGLNLRKVSDSIRGKSKEQPRDERGVTTPGQFVRQQVRANRAQRKREQKNDVVSSLRSGAEP